MGFGGRRAAWGHLLWFWCKLGAVICVWQVLRMNERGLMRTSGGSRFIMLSLLVKSIIAFSPPFHLPLTPVALGDIFSLVVS